MLNLFSKGGGGSNNSASSNTRKDDTKMKKSVRQKNSNLKSARRMSLIGGDFNHKLRGSEENSEKTESTTTLNKHQHYSIFSFNKKSSESSSHSDRKAKNESSKLSRRASMLFLPISRSSTNHTSKKIIRDESNTRQQEHDLWDRQSRGKQKETSHNQVEREERLSSAAAFVLDNNSRTETSTNHPYHTADAEENELMNVVKDYSKQCDKVLGVIAKTYEILTDVKLLIGDQTTNTNQMIRSSKDELAEIIRKMELILEEEASIFGDQSAKASEFRSVFGQLLDKTCLALNKKFTSHEWSKQELQNFMIQNVTDNERQNNTEISLERQKYEAEMCENDNRIEKLQKQCDQQETECQIIPLLHAQIEIYRADFQAERSAREEIAGKKADLEDKIQQLKDEHQATTRELKSVREILARTCAVGTASHQNGFENQSRLNGPNVNNTGDSRTHGSISQENNSNKSASKKASLTNGFLEHPASTGVRQRVFEIDQQHEYLNDKHIS